MGGVHSPCYPITLKEAELMDEHPSYHGSITSEEAKRRLNMHGGLCYLTRFSESHQHYMLSVYQDEPTEVIKHFRLLIDRNRDCAQIQGMEQSFKNISRLLSHYESKRIDPAFRNIGKPYREDRYARDAMKERSEALQSENERSETLLKLEALQRENQRLERENQQLEALQREIQRLEAQNQRLEALQRENQRKMCTIL